MKTTNLMSISFYSAFILFFFSCTYEEVTLDIAENLNEVESFQENDLTIANDFLDYGLYWFNVNNQSAKGFNEANNTAIIVNSSYYDPSKPTLIYFHGWQFGSSQDNYRREDFYFDDGNINTVQFWKNKGWNVGVFYWNQFADEIEVKDAEAKIWRATGPRNMRYRLSNGSYSELQSPSIPIANLAANQLQIALNGNNSNNVRFAGHSLGAQLATRTAMIISNRINSGSISSVLKVDRLELLDPFWSAGGKSYINNDWTGERSRDQISIMIDRNNLAVTWYNSSLITDVGVGDSNESLQDMVAYQSVRPWYVSAVDVATKHINVRHSYFWSVNFDAPREVTIDWLNRRRGTGNVAASATTRIARIRAMMGNDNEWDQVEGRYTPSPADDEFERK